MAALNKKIETAKRRILAALDLAGVDESIEVSFEIVDKAAPASEDHAPETITKSVRIIKADEERYVLGIVLEPTKEMDEPDAQEDVYSAEAVRQAAYYYMEKHQTLGIQHAKVAGERMKVLESWIQREDTTINGQVVKAGTWLLGARIVDDALWEDVKSGKFTGWSIGGVAHRQPI